MFLTTNRSLGWLHVLMSAEGGSGGGGTPAAATDTGGADAGATGDAKPAGDGGASDKGSADAGAASKDVAAAKEFAPDPNKSEAENAAAKAEHDKAIAANTVPADGKYALQMPEGMEVDQALLDALSPDFKDAGLTQAQAQKLADKFIAHQKAQGETKGADFGKTIAGWIDQAKADPEMGGDKWGGTAEAASGAIKEFGSDGLKAYLNETGGGNHPELIRFAAKAGAEIARLRALIKEDDPVTDTAQGGRPTRDTASILYPNDPPRKD